MTAILAALLLASPASAFTLRVCADPNNLPFSNKAGEGFAITSSHLTVNAKIPGADAATFERIANEAKAGCPVSKVLNATITTDATLDA